MNRRFTRPGAKLGIALLLGALAGAGLQTVGAGPVPPPVGAAVVVAIPAPCSAVQRAPAGGCRVPRAALVTGEAGGGAVDLVYWLPGAGEGIPLLAVPFCQGAPPTAPCYDRVPPW